MPGERFRAGQLIRLWMPSGDLVEPRVVPVELAERRRIWVALPGPEIEAGELVMLERAIPGDSRYQSTAEVVSRVKDRIALGVPDSWTRVQDRSFVRVATERVPVEGVRHEPGNPRLPLAMLDLSAGGMRVEGPEELALGDAVDCRFRLDGVTAPFEIEARVVRVLAAGRAAASQAGLAFASLPHRVAQEITRWVFERQLRSHHAKKP